MDKQIAERYKRELERVRHSKSWRVTKPFRVAVYVSKKVLKKAKNPNLVKEEFFAEKQNNLSVQKPLNSDETALVLRLSAVAEIAMDKKDWSNAALNWRRIIDKFNSRTPAGVYVRLSICYRKLGKYTLAKNLVLQGIRVYPEYIPLRTEDAEIVMDCEDWGKAILKWKKIMKKFQNKTPADIWVKLARAYRFNKNLMISEKVAKEGLEKFPGQERLIFEYATVATEMGNHKEAINRWRPVLDSLNKNSSPADWIRAIDARYYTSIAKRIVEISDYKKLIESYKSQQRLNSKNNKPNKIVVYTAISGGYDSLKLPEKICNKVDYILFTDKPMVDTGIYKVRPLPYFSNDPARTTRYVKTHAHTLLSEYDTAVWVDASVLITGNIYPMIKKFVDSNKPLAAIPHPDRKTVYEEVSACIRYKKDEEETLNAQRDHYRQLKFKSNILIESGLMIYNLRNKEVEGFLGLWWKEIENYSKRDQLSLGFALEQTGIPWLPLTKRPNSIRNHPLFVLAPHKINHDVSDELINKISGSKKIDPFLEPNFLSVRKARIDAQKERRIDIVVCVHNAYSEVKKCLKSIEDTRASENVKLIIVDDGSDSETANYLQKFEATRAWATLTRNNSAGGYSRAANKGLRASTAEFVVLLNSDTVVTDGWVEKLADAAFSSTDIGIVGPLSSAASHQSIPEHLSSKTQTAINSLPENMSIDDMSTFCEKWSYSTIFPRVPLVHGFCFGIKRSLIEAIGYFDQKSFPRGYGEENDYCFRATDAGFGMLIATNTYVYHAKSKSYTDAKRQALMTSGSKKLVELYGKDRIRRSILSMQSNPILERLRKKAAKLYVN